MGTIKRDDLSREQVQALFCCSAKALKRLERAAYVGPRVDYRGVERYDPDAVRMLREEMLLEIPRNWAARLLRTSAAELIRLEARGAVRPEMIDGASRVIYAREAFEAAERALAAAPRRAATLARRMRIEAQRPAPRALRPLDMAAQARADARAERDRLQQIQDEAKKAAKRKRRVEQWWATHERKERERRQREKSLRKSLIAHMYGRA